MSFEYLLPEVGRSICPARRVGRVAGAAVAPLVEGEKMRRAARQPRGHQHRLGINSEVDQRATPEFENRLSRIAVLLVLAPSVLDGLTSKWVLELHRGHRNTV